MAVYKLPIEVAILVFLFVAFILTIPFLIHHYRKYGAIPILRSILFYSFILYLISAYFLVILPLPKKEVVAHLTPRAPQLIPFHFINVIIKNTIFQWNDITTYISALKNPVVYTTIFNIFLCLPFGVYLKYYFNKRWYQTVLYTFFLSLFFELTQLSGLYGIYPKAYRLFDVDDLIINTLGGLCGFWFAKFFMIFLPPREKLEEISYEKGKKVSMIRRIVALFIDLLFLSSISLILKIIFYHSTINKFSFSITILIYYLFVPFLLKGATLGKKVVRIKITNTKGDSLKWYALLFRNIFCFIFFIYPLVILSSVIECLPNHLKNIVTAVAIPILTLNYLINIICYFHGGKKKEHQFLYEKLTHTKNISTITVIEPTTNKQKNDIDKPKKQ